VSQVSVVSIEALVKKHGPTTVLAGVSASAELGSCVVIEGPSGAGKSTLLRCLNGLEGFDGGQLSIAGHTVRGGQPPGREALRRLRGDVGMVFQSFELFPHLSARDNVALAPRVVHRVSRAEALARADELLARVHLAERAHAQPGQLSGGQKQRVAIALALATRPKVLLFDEPTSALDPQMRDEVLAVMRELHQGGLTMLIVSHDPAARQLADRLWRIRAGGLESLAPEGRP
jgi:glutamine transport system ATP-binding protein